MFDPGDDRRPQTSDERWITALFAALVLGLFAAEVFRDYSPAKLSALLVLLFWIPLLALHEAGHAVMAALLGWRVGRVVIGGGSVLGAFSLGGASVEIRLLPIEGFVQSVPADLRFPRLKDALIYFAGPAADLLAAAAVLLLVGPERLFSRSDEYGLIVCQSLALAGAAQGLINLVPHAISTPDGHIANDGLGILRSIFQPQSHYAALIGSTWNPHEQQWEQSDDPVDRWNHH